MTKNDMVRKIAAEMGIQQLAVKQVIQLTLDGIIECVASEGRLELRNFGILEVRTRKPHKARNPRTGEPVMVPERKMVAFRAGRIMAARITGKPAAGPGATAAPDSQTQSRKL